MDKICKQVKDGLPGKDPQRFSSLVRKSRHYCRKCGCTASDKNLLCKPEKIRKQESDK